MPLIEELPTTAVHRVTHGWAYVPDTGPLQISAVQPGNRKRGAGANSNTPATATVKQQKAVQQRLDSLDKENYKDGVTVPVPPRPERRGGDRGSRKMTSNVRRILTYQRAFAHYLADEEANAQNAPTSSASLQNTAAATATQSSRAGGGGGSGVVTTSLASSSSSRRKSNLRESTVASSSTSTPTPTPAKGTGTGRRGRPPGKNKDKNKSLPSSLRQDTIKNEDGDVQMTDSPSTTTTTTTKDTSASSNQTTTATTTTATATTATTTTTPRVSTPMISTPPPPKPPYDPSLDSHPLLRTTGLPKMPTDRVMRQLTSEPPLSYTAARAVVLTTDEKGTSTTMTRPARHFCGVCGYWGRVKCRRCHEWTCGIMECWKGHEAVCPAVGLY